MSPADEAWVKELYEANARKMYKIALRRLGDKEEAENIVQEAFLLLLVRFDLVKIHPNPPGWLMKVVQNLIRHSIDRSQRQSNHETPIDEQVAQLSAPPKQILSLRICYRRASPRGSGICWSGSMRTSFPMKKLQRG